MTWKHIALRVLFSTPLLATGIALAQASATDTPPQPPAATPTHAFSINVYDRTRTDVYDWYSDPPYTTTYPFVEQLLRVSIAQRLKHIDWLAELGSNDVLDVPTTSVSPVTAQGNLGLGGNYYAASPNTNAAAAALRQGYIRFHGKAPDTNLRVGRFEFFDGAETTPKDPTIIWLQTNRVAQRLIGNFGFTVGQRSFDGADAHYGKGSWDITGMAGRAVQGVFNMNANPELNVDLQYLAFSKYDFSNHFLWRVFAIDYHDGRTGIAKTDNRALAVRQADHKNIRVGTYGADFITALPVGPGEFDVLFWGVLQNGNWGLLSQHSGALATEAGYRFNSVTTRPWLRGGFFRGTGDNNSTDTVHNTFFQILPTARAYARFPFFDLMNSTDDFAQVVDSPLKHLEIRSDLHFLKLTSNKDLWYQGGGAYDNKSFGFAGRPAGGHNSFATLADISSDYQITPAFALNLYYAHSYGKSVVKADYPAGQSANLGYLELVYKWGIKQNNASSK
jgi:Alginate export